VNYRTYHDVTGSDRSQLGAQVGAQRERVTERLRDVKRIVAVMSGKGGVGKSYVTGHLARVLAGGLDVGVLDADLRGPTVSRLLAARGPLRVSAAGVEPSLTVDGIKVVSTDLLLEEGQPLAWNDPGGDQFVWRGILEAGALREFLADVVWGALDILLIDLPPGADGVTDLFDLVPGLTGILAVTIPSDESRRSVARSLRAAQEAGIPILGIVENMSGTRCRGCGREEQLFEGDAGTALADEFAVPLVAQVPFAPVGTQASAEDWAGAVSACRGESS